MTTLCRIRSKSTVVLTLAIAIIMLLVMLDTRSQYNSFMISTKSSDFYHPSDLGEKRRAQVRLTLPPTNSNRTGKSHHPNPNHSAQDEQSQLNSKDGGGSENNDINSNKLLPKGGPPFSADNSTPTLIFWSLMNGSTKTDGTFNESGQLSNLWRPEALSSNFLLEQRDDDRVLAQLIWGVQAANLIESTGRSLQMQTIYLPDSFSWWGKTNWQSPHVLEKEDCPGNLGIWRKCSFSESRDSMNAMITVPETFATLNFSVPMSVLRFYFMLESPMVYDVTLRRTNDLMASFYRGSDVTTPYGKWVYFDPSVRFKHQEKNYHKGKSKMAAIFTSNCDPWNNRLGFVKELENYMEVDVFGDCGKKECARFNQTNCYTMLKQDYFFYLSFENSNCRDYVTEKLFTNAFENDVIPIVLGAHPLDYKAMCPEKSYIPVDDFPSPKELADYMHRLADNPEEYNSYFRWKGTGKFVDTHFLCRVCAMVHYADIVPPPLRKTPYFLNSEVAINNKICLPFGAWYWNQYESKATSSVFFNNWTVVVVVAWRLASIVFKLFFSS